MVQTHVIDSDGMCSKDAEENRADACEGKGVPEKGEVAKLVRERKDIAHVVLCKRAQEKAGHDAKLAQKSKSLWPSPIPCKWKEEIEVELDRQRPCVAGTDASTAA